MITLNVEHLLVIGWGATIALLLWEHWRLRAVRASLDRRTEQVNKLLESTRGLLMASAKQIQPPNTQQPTTRLTPEQQAAVMKMRGVVSGVPITPGGGPVIVAKRPKAAVGQES